MKWVLKFHVKQYVAFSYATKKTCQLVRKPGSGRPTKITQPILQAIEAKMQADDETTATQLQHVLKQKWI